MTTGVRSWLPANVAERAVVRETIDQVVRSWSQAWFSRPSLGVSSLSAAPGEAPTLGADLGWRRIGEVVALSCSKRAALRLLDWTLDVHLSDHHLNDIDRQLLDGVEQQLMADLSTRLERALGAQAAGGHLAGPAQAPFGSSGGVVVGVSDGQLGVLFSIAIPMAVLLPLCQPRAAPTKPKPARLESMAQALGPAKVTFEANLGQADIALADLRGLSCGDVLVLSTALGDAAEISLPGASGDVVARAKLAEVEGQMALVFQG